MPCSSKARLSRRRNCSLDLPLLQGPCLNEELEDDRRVAEIVEAQHGQVFQDQVGIRWISAEVGAHLPNHLDHRSTSSL